MDRRWADTSDSQRNHDEIPSKTYVCGYCGEPLASNEGYYAWSVTAKGATAQPAIAHIYICHHCQNPTYFDENGEQTPGPAFGSAVKNIPSREVNDLYDEARNCMRVGAYTAAALCCRRLLMNVAVDQGADEDKSFAYYVKYLSDQGYLPPNGEKWVDHIRSKGNEATHEIPIMGVEDAKELIKFSEMMLNFIYEYPVRLENRVQKVEAQSE